MVNTIRIEKDGRLAGKSSDGGGFLDAAREAGVFDPGSAVTTVIGAGGAGRAICHALAAVQLIAKKTTGDDAWLLVA